MPIKRAAVRQLRKDRKRTVHNLALRSEIKTLKKRLLTLLSENKHAEAAKLLPTVIKRFDQAAGKNILHKKTASRTKSRLMRRVGAGSSST